MSDRRKSRSSTSSCSKSPKRKVRKTSVRPSSSKGTLKPPRKPRSPKPPKSKSAIPKSPKPVKRKGRPRNIDYQSKLSSINIRHTAEEPNVVKQEVFKQPSVIDNRNYEKQEPPVPPSQPNQFFMVARLIVLTPYDFTQASFVGQEVIRMAISTDELYKLMNSSWLMIHSVQLLYNVMNPHKKKVNGLITLSEPLKSYDQLGPPLDGETAFGNQAPEQEDQNISFQEEMDEAEIDINAEIPYSVPLRDEEDLRDEDMDSLIEMGDQEAMKQSDFCLR